MKRVSGRKVKSNPYKELVRNAFKYDSKSIHDMRPDSGLRKGKRYTGKYLKY